jgi:hypothetical protein
VKKYGRVRQATDNSIIRCMRLACWITKARDAHSEYVYLYCFSTGVMVTHTCLSVINTFPVILYSNTHIKQQQNEICSLCGIKHSCTVRMETEAAGSSKMCAPCYLTIQCYVSENDDSFALMP